MRGVPIASWTCFDGFGHGLQFIMKCSSLIQYALLVLTSSTIESTMYSSAHQSFKLF